MLAAVSCAGSSDRSCRKPVRCGGVEFAFAHRHEDADKPPHHPATESASLPPPQ